MIRFGKDLEKTDKLREKVEEVVIKQTIKQAFIYELAKFMHDTYEEKAKEVGWNTQETTKVPFDDLPEPNKITILEVANEVINWFGDRTS